MGNTSDRVRRARRQAGLSQGELANRIGLTQPTISELEKGKSKSSSYLVQIAQACGVSAHWLATGEGDMLEAADNDSGAHNTKKNESNLSPGPAHARSVPELSWAQAAKWNWKTQRMTEALDLAGVKHWPCPVSCSERTISLRVEGESMIPDFPPRALIFVDPAVVPTTGRKVVARLVDQDGQEQLLFRQYIEEGGERFLKALNPHWPSQYTNLSESCEILGTVVFIGMEA